MRKGLNIQSNVLRSYPGYELRPFLIRHPTAFISLSTNNRVSGLKNAKKQGKAEKVGK